MTVTNIPVFIVTSFLALLTHAATQYKEPYGHHAFCALLGYLTLSPMVCHFILKLPWLHSLNITLTALCVYSAVLTTSILSYRHLFHPLRRIPGPWWAKTTMWFWVPIDASGRRCQTLEQLHKVYGSVVRIGPNAVSIADETLMPLVYGPTTVRGPWYGVFPTKPGCHSLQEEPTFAGHAARRRQWDPAFSATSLRGYRPCVQKTCSEMLDLIVSDLRTSLVAEALESPKHAVLDLHKYIAFFTFDVVGQIGHGKSPELLHSEENRKMVQLIQQGFRFIAPAGDVPYMPIILTYLLSDPLWEFRLWLKNTVEWRIRKSSEEAKEEGQHLDVLGHLISPRRSNSTVPSREQATPALDNLLLDASLLTVAGSDTVKSAIVMTLLELSQRPDILAQLRKEVEGVQSNDDDTLLRPEATPVLHAVIEETLRLWPVIPAGLPRSTTQKQTWLPGGYVVPAATCLSVPTWIIQRSPSNFVRPTEWIPERWLDPQEYVPHNIKAHMPFSYGSTGCIGKRLAWMEMCIAVASFVTRFDFEMSKEDAQAFRNSVRHYFIVEVGPLNMKIRERPTRG